MIDRLNRALAGDRGPFPTRSAADSLSAANPLIDLIYNYPDMSRFGGVRRSSKRTSPRS